MRHVHTILAITCIFSVITASAVQLTGTVKDENGDPVAGAEVKVWGKDITTTSKTDGSFVIESDELKDGNRYSVTVTADGYDKGQTLSTEAYSDPELAIPLEVEMFKAAPPPEIEDVELTGQDWTNRYAGGPVGSIMSPTNDIADEAEVEESFEEENIMLEEPEEEAEEEDSGSGIIIIEKKEETTE